MGTSSTGPRSHPTPVPIIRPIHALQRPAIAFWLQSCALVAAVAELGSLIWLHFVKRTVVLRSGKFLFFPVSRHRGCIESGAGTLFLRLSNAEMRESTRGAWPLREVIKRSRSDAASCLSLGTRVGLVTASNDPPESRLTGSLPLVQFSLAGCVFIVVLSLSSFVFILKASALSFPPSGGESLHTGGGVAGAGRGLTIRPMAQTKPASSRPSAAAATVDFLRPTPTRCL